MVRVRFQLISLIILPVVVIAVVGCTSPSTQAIPSQSNNPTSTVISPTFQEPNLSASAISTSTTDFPLDVYPSALSFLNPVNGITTKGCPDLINVKTESELPGDTAMQLINALRSGDLQSYKLASDQSYWPSDQETLVARENVSAVDIQAHPAIQTPYDGLIRTGCGQKTLDLSWWVEVGTGALGEHYFLINRSGYWLVWASYP